MTYDKTLEWLDEVALVGSKLGLSRTCELLELMGNPQNKLKFIHVAGTNGKGSVCACLSEVLSQAGYKTGMYTSPHLMRINERFKINGEDIDDKEFAALITKVRDITESMSERASQFEVLTAAAFEYFYKEGCDIVVLETGLGGRLDSTNVINAPEVTLITTIEMDHMAELGDTIEKIALEKAGIIKRGTKVVVDGRNISVMHVFEKACKEQGCKLIISEIEKIENLRVSLEQSKFDYKDIKDIDLSLTGLYQPGNAILAVEGIKILIEKGFKISDEDIKAALKKVHWQARFEIMDKEPYFIIDGSHNPAGVSETVKSIKAYFPDKKIRFIIGILSDKNIDEILTDIKPLAKEVAVITPPSSRACKAEDMIKLVEEKISVSNRAFESIKEAVDYMLDSAKKDDIICAMGSLYSVGELKKAFYEHGRVKDAYNYK
jgi:bifunctional protein folC